MSDELLPCPFCGCGNVFVSATGHTQCMAAGCSANTDSQKDWQRRKAAPREIARDAARLNALRKCRAHTSYPPGADYELLAGLLASIERICDAALEQERNA